MSHTKGPWHMGAGNGEGSIFSDTGRMRYERGTVLYPIATVNRGFDQEEDEANGRLLAAAPELLEALEAIIPWIDQTGIADSDPPQYLAALAAIAKARGEQPPAGNLGTFVCDSCGERHPAELKRNFMDEAMEGWDLCPKCYGERSES